MASDILLVLGVVEGRRFPKRPHHQLMVEAKFDGEVLNTDLIKHQNTPQFNTELAWEIDKKSLHQHRLQRTPIKVQVYAKESSSMKKESMGYCILDLRTAQQDSNKKAEWHALLSSKYHHMKPEIKLKLSLEADQVKQMETKKAEEVKQSLIVEDTEEDLDVVLDDEQGYYLIGQENAACQIFVLSVSIGGAKNLVKLLPSNTNINSEVGFYFYYSLFDNDVTNETFYDLMNPAMTTERATIRIYTTPKRLAKYLRNKQVIEVYLCSAESTLGQASVSLQLLIADGLFNTPNVVEGLFPIKPSDGSLIPDEYALVGVSITLRKEDDALGPDISPVHAQQKPKLIDSPKLLCTSKKMPTLTTPPKRLIEKKTPEKKIPEKKMKNVHSAARRDLNNKEKNHHFLFSIDLRSISCFDIKYPLNCICRYTYPFFGSSAPIMTNPPVYVQRNIEVLLPQSFCKFEFASTTQLLQSTLSRVPLIIEVWRRDTNTKDQLLGIAQVHLSCVLLAENKSASNSLIRSEKVPIVVAESPAHKIGVLHIVLGLEDRGEVNSASPSRNILNSFSTDVVSTEEAASSVASNIMVPGGAARNMQEYQVAMALELWRHQQEEYFQNQLNTKETERMNALSEEWKQRDLEREMILKKKLHEYGVLEGKLKNSLHDIQLREKQISEHEQQLERNKKLLAEEYDRKMIELRDASRRLNDDYQHQLQIEKMKYTELEDRNKQHMKQLHELECKLKDRENDVYALKEKMLSRPEIKIQSDMNVLLLEKSELERRLEAVTKSKIHYKQQWGRALRELARIKLNEQEAAKLRLQKQQQELDHMKLRYLAAEEKQVMQNEKEELLNVKKEVHKRLDQLHSTNEVPSELPKEGGPKEVNKVILDSKSKVAKLVHERDTLLQTGVYSLDDRVINELDREIQLLISDNG